MAEDIVGSKMAPKNGYGQNGYQGASSDLPGQHTTSGFLPQSGVPTDAWQTRNVSKEPIKPSYGMKAGTPKSEFPTSNVRRAHVPANPKSFQR